MLSRLLTGVAKSVVFAAALRTPDTKVRSPSYYLTAWLLLLNYGGPLSGPGLLAGPISGFEGQSGALSVSSIAFCWALHRVRRSWGRYSRQTTLGKSGVEKLAECNLGGIIL